LPEPVLRRSLLRSVALVALMAKEDNDRENLRNTAKKIERSG
jgi:hypothetical protein